MNRPLRRMAERIARDFCRTLRLDMRQKASKEAHKRLEQDICDAMTFAVTMSRLNPRVVSALRALYEAAGESYELLAHVLSAHDSEPEELEPAPEDYHDTEPDDEDEDG